MLVQKQTLSRTGCDFTDTAPNVTSNMQRRYDERWCGGRQATIAELIARVREGSQDALTSTEKTNTRGGSLEVPIMSSLPPVCPTNPHSPSRNYHRLGGEFDHQILTFMRIQRVRRSQNIFKAGDLLRCQDFLSRAVRRSESAQGRHCTHVGAPCRVRQRETKSLCRKPGSASRQGLRPPHGDKGQAGFLLHTHAKKKKNKPTVN